MWTRLAPARARARLRRRAARGRALRSRAERSQRRLRQRLLGPRARSWRRASAPSARSRTRSEADDSIRAIGAFCKREKVDAWYRAVPQIDISTARAQDGSWREAVEGLRALGHGEEYAELTRGARSRQICRSPVFRGAARSSARRRPSSRRGWRSGCAPRCCGAACASTRTREVLGDRGARRRRARAHAARGGGRGYLSARAAVLAAGWRTLRWPGFARELTRRLEPHRADRAGARRARADRLDGRRAARRLPPDAALLPHDERRRGSRSAGAAGGSPTTRAPDRRLELDAEVVERAAGGAAPLLPAARGPRDHARLGRADRRRAERGCRSTARAARSTPAGASPATASAPRTSAGGSCRGSRSACATRSRRCRSSSRRSRPSRPSPRAGSAAR